MWEKENKKKEPDQNLIRYFNKPKLDRRCIYAKSKGQ